VTEQHETEPAPARQVFTFAQMMPTGVLWLINRTVFHPRGLALGITVIEGDGETHAEGWEILASPDGTPYRYDDDETEARKHRAVEELLDLVRLNGVMPPPINPPAPGTSVAVPVDPAE
jgi:hypothetical protein